MADAGVHPNIAQMMMPDQPQHVDPPAATDPNDDGTQPWAPPF